MTAEKTTSAAPEISDLDPQSLAAIRNLLASEPEVEPQPVAQRVAEKQAVQQAANLASAAPEHAPKPRKGMSFRSKGRKAQGTPPSAPRLDAPQTGLVGGLKAKITGYRPTAKHIVFAGIALLIFFRPWLVIGLLFLTAFIMTAVFLILGYDGFWRRVMGGARWYARRRPARAAELHRKLDRFALKFDAFLDRFPEGSVDGLYLPDFGDMAAADARHNEAVDRRLDSLRETGA